MSQISWRAVKIRRSQKSWSDNKMPDQATIHIRKGQAPQPITRAEFHARFNARFYDPAYEVERAAIDRLETIAWDAIQVGRKAPLTQAAQKRWQDPTGPVRVLLICGSARNDGTCPG